jgi:predicted enzyme related to lactoylglutathione lyase
MKWMVAVVLSIALISQTGSGKEVKMPPHVTGIGGVFFKSKGDHKALVAWYQEHLGIRLEPFGAAVFRWPKDTAEDKGVTAWHVAEKSTTWFSPSESSFMINYRVDDLSGMIGNLEKAGVKILKGPESHENGKFAWIMDPEGNKVELWEPKIWDDRNKGP